MEIPHKKNNKDIPLSKEVAEQMLSNVFAACEYEGNRIPLDVLLSYSNYRRERYLLQKIVIILVLLAFLLMPVLFVTPELHTGWLPNTEPGRPVVQLEIDSFLPLDSITASIDGYALHVYQSEEGVYQIHPDRNGSLLLTVTLANKQFTQTKIQVEGVDVTAPVMISNQKVGDLLEIFLEDDSGTLDFEAIYAMDYDGNRIEPVSYDADKMSVSFAYPDRNMNIFVPDKCQNTLQLVLTLQ